MTSGKKARQQRRTPPPPVRSTGGPRKASPKVLAVGAGVILLSGIVAAAAIALTRGSSSPSSTSTTKLLGSPKAPVRLIEYIDLQCPVCREFETTVMPSIVPRYVRTGKVQVIARPIAFIGPDSVTGRLAALAAAKQNHFFDFSQLLYANQGTENTGWLNDSIISAAYNSIPGLDRQAAEQARASSEVSSEANTFDSQATADKVQGTPTVLVGKHGGPLTFVGPGSPSVATLEAALNKSLAQ